MLWSKYLEEYLVIDGAVSMALCSLAFLRQSCFTAPRSHGFRIASGKIHRILAEQSDGKGSYEDGTQPRGVATKTTVIAAESSEGFEICSTIDVTLSHLSR